jgi:hypothetical protein
MIVKVVTRETHKVSEIDMDWAMIALDMMEEDAQDGSPKFQWDTEYICGGESRIVKKGTLFIEAVGVLRPFLLSAIRKNKMESV